MSRESFLSRVRQAAQAGRAYRVHLQPVPPEVGYIGAAGDLCDRMAEEVDAVGGKAFRVPDLLAARELLGTLLNEVGAKSSLCWEHDVLRQLGLGEFVATRGVALHSYESLSRLDATSQRAAMLACDIGITSVDVAIAETATLLVCARPGQERVASLLPPMHVAIVERSQIVPDLLDAFQMLHERGLSNLPSNITLITGPSKTGDIELQLTTGVHGPGKWRVIIVR